MSNHSLSRIAASLGCNTKVAAKAALKAAGLKQALADDLLAERRRIVAARTTAKLDRLDRRLGYCAVQHDSPKSARRWSPRGVDGTRGGSGICIRAPEHGTPRKGPLATLPKGTLDQRLARVRKAAVLNTLGSVIDQHSHGDWTCVLATDPAKVGVRCEQYYTGEKAGKWSIRATDTCITVPADWRMRVQRRGLALVDGLMTLDASPLEAQGCELFAATWARRTGVKGVSVDRGYIARSGAVTYHGKTVDQALTGLTKKARQLEISARLASADLGALVAKCPQVLVSVGDASATGACMYGIRSWCEAVGLPVEYDLTTDTLSGQASLAEVYAAYQREPRVEARATILRVLRRNRVAIEC